jgi:hypothetical protein
MRMKRALAFVMATIIGLTALAGSAIGTERYATDLATVKRQIRNAWLGNDKKALRVVECESSFNPKATSPGGTYLGLWQFSRSTWDAYDGPGNDPRDVNARRQTEVAWRLYVDQGWAPWPNCP